jgi:hypothetical protein
MVADKAHPRKNLYDGFLYTYQFMSEIFNKAQQSKRFNPTLKCPLMFRVGVDYVIRRLNQAFARWLFASVVSINVFLSRR